MTKIPDSILTPKTPLIDYGIYGLLFVMLISASAVFVAEANLSERIVFTRYWHFLSAGFFAFILPHLLFPVRKPGWLQSLNPNGKTLRKLQLSHLYPVFWLFGASYGILAFFDPMSWSDDLGKKLHLFAESMIFLFALVMYSFYRYSIIGARSQAWSEGKRGHVFLRNMARIGQSSATPPGMYPTFGATAGIAAGGMLLVVAQAWMSSFATYVSLLPFLFFGAYSVAKVVAITSFFDRHLYQTSSFYDELFRNPSGHHATDRTPLRVENVYWSPPVIRASVWALLLQLDRRIPFGRIMLLMILFLWVILYSGLPLTIFTGALMLFILIKNALIFMSVSPKMAPLAFHHYLHHTGTWIMIRFFANLRWVLPMLLALLIAALFSQRLNYSDVLFWMYLDVFTALLMATVATLLHEGRYTSRYA